MGVIVGDGVLVGVTEGAGVLVAVMVGVDVDPDCSEFDPGKTTRVIEYAG